jgi:hypothetical protein
MHRELPDESAREYWITSIQAFPREKLNSRNKFTTKLKPCIN